MRQISRPTALGIMAAVAAIAVLDGRAAWRAARADGIQGINAHVVAANIPGASAMRSVSSRSLRANNSSALVRRALMLALRTSGEPARHQCGPLSPPGRC